MRLKNSIKEENKINETLIKHSTINQNTNVFETQTFDNALWFFCWLIIYVFDTVNIAGWLDKSSKKEKENPWTPSL